MMCESKWQSFTEYDLAEVIDHISDVYTDLDDRAGMVRYLETKGITPDEARELLSTAPGVSVLDDRDNNRFPMPIDATGQDDVFVGRIRQDDSIPDNRGINLWVAGDQLRKGAALNAVQIAEKLL